MASRRPPQVDPRDVQTRAEAQQFLAERGLLGAPPGPAPSIVVRARRGHQPVNWATPKGQQTRDRVLAFIRQLPGPMLVQDIAREMGLSRHTVYGHVTGLIATGRVRNVGHGKGVEAV